MSEISYVACLERTFGGREIYYVGTDFKKANQVIEAYSLDYEDDCYVLEVWSDDLKMMEYKADVDNKWRITSDARENARYGIVRAEEEIERLRNSLSYWEESLKENTERRGRLDELVKRIPITESEEL